MLGVPAGRGFRMEGSWRRPVLAVPGRQLWCPWDGGDGDIRVFDEILMGEGVTPGSPGRRWVSKGLDREGSSREGSSEGIAGREYPLEKKGIPSRTG